MSFGGGFQTILHSSSPGSVPCGSSIRSVRQLASAKHLGKVVLSLVARDFPIAPSLPAPLKLDAGSTYLITGGLGGVGLSLASWLVARGARHLALVGRAGAATEKARQTVKDLESRGVEVRVLRTDVSDRAALSSLLGEVGRQMPPLKGIFHGAMVLEDTLFSQLNPESHGRVLAAKAWGAWHLHSLTRELPLDHFVLFSSIVSETGNVGQASTPQPMRF